MLKEKEVRVIVEETKVPTIENTVEEGPDDLVPSFEKGYTLYDDSLPLPKV